MTALELASEAVRRMRGFEFAEAARLAQESMDAVASEPKEAQIEVARILVRPRAIFPNTQTAQDSEVYFRAVYEACVILFGAESKAALTASDTLAGLLQSNGKFAEALPMKELLYRKVRETAASDDTSAMLARDNMALMYRGLGRHEQAARLYEDTGICEHLKAVQVALVAGGAAIVSCGRPWSDNCHIWVYFDRVLDCATLMREHQLPDCVTIHDHRGTHDGSERGLVCNTHNDAIMGRHPSG